MSTFRILNPFPTYLDLSGNLAAGGSLKFYESGTTTPKDVYGDPDKDTNNGSSVDIGSDGRPVVDIWGDGEYRVRLYAADNTLVDEADHVAIAGGTGATIPDLEASKFLTNDGAVMLWQPVRQVPDPTGSANKILMTDGENLIWTTKPKDGEAGKNAAIDVTSKSLAAGNGSDDQFFIQAGSGSAEMVSSRKCSANVTFDTAFKSSPAAVIVIPAYSGSLTQYGNNCVPHIVSKTASGFEVEIGATELDDNNSGWNFSGAIGFQYVAFGLK